MEKEITRLEETVKFCCIADAIRQNNNLADIIGIHAKHICCNGSSYFLILTINEKDICNFKKSADAIYA